MNMNYIGHEPALDFDGVQKSPFDQMMDVLHVIADKIGPQPTVEQNLLLDEYAVNPNGNSITLIPQIERPALITSMIASIPSGATNGILTVGTPGTGLDRRVINITPTTPPFNGIALVIYPSDVLVLSFTGSPGIVFIEIMGGILRGTDWRVI